MEIRIVRTPMTWSEVGVLAKAQFGEMIKAAVDVSRGVMALGGDLHSDEEELLLNDGSKQEDIWGINLYPAKPAVDRVEFDSMINVRPSQDNRTRGVENPDVRRKIIEVVEKLVQ